MGKKLKYNCVFGGGGIRGVCYVGAVKALKEYNIEFNSLAGSSVGAVFVALYAAGCNEKEIEELFIEFNLHKFRDLNINLFDNDFSISKGEIFLDWLREKIGKKIYGKEYSKEKRVKFKDIEKDIYILTLDLNTNLPFIFSKKDTPDEEIAFAVRASAGLPGLMKPVKYKNMLLVDGDLIKSKPAFKIFDEYENSEIRILEMRLEGTPSEGIKNPANYVNSLINTVWYLSTENIYEDYAMNDRYDLVVFDTKDTVLFDFTVGKEKKEELSLLGYKTIKHFFEKTLPKKKEKIISIYSKVYEATEKLSKEIKRNDYKNLRKNLYDIIIYLYKNKIYTDKNIIYEFDILKEMTDSGMKKISFIRPKPENHKEIAQKTDYIKELLRNRSEELSEFINKR